MSKNITLSIDEALLDRAKEVASRRRTSINALVRGFLAEIVAKEKHIDDAREALLKLAREKQGDLGSSRWEREALYDR